MNRAESIQPVFLPSEAPDPPAAQAPAERLIRLVRRHALGRDPEYRRYHGARPVEKPGDKADFHFATSRDPHLPDEVFPTLHWGGELIFVTPDLREAEALAARYDGARGFILARPVTRVQRRFLGLPMPSLGRGVYYFAARKVLLIPPGETTTRFTYHVELAPDDRDPHGQPCVVRKAIPSYDSVLWRLAERFPDAGMDVIAQRARKLVDHVFPVFLTREAAILNILQRDLPEPYRRRVPRVIDKEKDRRGFVRCLYLNWLRLGGRPLTQLEFAHQSTDLLQALHDTAGVIHLDLRLDNFVITPDGVGFVDFGSAVRVNENLGESRMLTSLFEEMMRTSQIQRMLGKMKRSGTLTSQEIRVAHQRVDKAVDFFYLAVQFNKPHLNPDLRHLIQYDPDSAQAKALARLTDRILRPENPEAAEFRCARDILRGIEAIERELGGRRR